MEGVILVTEAWDIPQDDRLGEALEALRPGNVLAAARERFDWVEEAVRSRWRAVRTVEVLYHPGRHVVVAYALLHDADLPERRSWPEAEVIYVRTPVREPMSRRGRVVEFGNIPVEVYAFPNDRRLRGLRKFAKTRDALRTWQGWLDETDGGRIRGETLQRLLVRYVPEQKWVARLRAEVENAADGSSKKRRIAARCTTTAICRTLTDRHAALSRAAEASGEAFRVPPVVGVDEAQGVLAVEWNRGRSLVETLREHDAASVLGGLAGALHALHETKISSLPPLNAEALTRSAQEAVEDIGYCCAAVKPRLDALLGELRERLPRLDGGRRVTVHNDFHWDQVRFKHGMFTVLDLERMALGDPLVDVSNLTAQLRMLGDRADTGVAPAEGIAWAHGFLEQWCRRGGSVSLERFQTYTVCALLKLAYGMMRHFRPGWRALLTRCLDEAEATLASTTHEVLR